MSRSGALPGGRAGPVRAGRGRARRTAHASARPGPAPPARRAVPAGRPVLARSASPQPSSWRRSRRSEATRPPTSRAPAAAATCRHIRGRSRVVTTGSGGSPYTSGSSSSRKNAPPPPMPSPGSSRYSRAPRLPGLVQLADPLLGPLPQLVQRAELDRLGRAGLGAGRAQPVADPVVAQRALVRAAVGLAPRDDAERAGRDAVAAAVADVVLDHHGAELGAHQRAGRAHVQAGGLGAVLAHVAGHQPAGAAAENPAPLGEHRRRRNRPAARARVRARHPGARSAR